MKTADGCSKIFELIDPEVLKKLAKTYPRLKRLVRS